MREVTLRWERSSLLATSMGALDEIVQRITIMGNLLINEHGIRQIAVPEFREGMGPEHLDELEFLSVEDELSTGVGGALVVFNSHPLCRLATNTENIHILVPIEYQDGNFTITIRGLPHAVAGFVRLSEAIIPPAIVRVRNIDESKDELGSLLTQRQFECFELAGKLGYYEAPKRITIQGLAEVMGIARSTYQEHLNSAEQAALGWLSQRLN
jgi:hypothetical protein